ncbi:ABC transporter substrate-binding protein [Sulfurimonas sp. HSL-3221]|uniref:ABC transporter substrate-binding protein n=1 Tax=Sulfurimonadaceae TaxID=2771471 RepID=UPI001E464D74|nr:ABC transporter substrate-binding protein [Sulfurimonas sp. HSL-3221]UFS62701.1 ABC transporter substrate-binding protein [Sulfurimonas sp. HSL-3221]
MRLHAVLLVLLFLSLALRAHEARHEHIVLQLQWLPQFQFAGYYVAKEKGFYTDAGLDVEIRVMKPETDVEQEVLSGRAQYGTGRTSLLVNYESGAPLVAMAAIFQSSPMMLLVREDSGIRTIKDLRGKRVMMTSDVQTAASVQAMLRNAGMKEEDLVLIHHTFDPLSLERNETDAMAAYSSNEPYVLAQRGIKTFAIDPKVSGFDFYNDILFTSQAELKQYPERVKRFYEASLKGWRYAFAHIDETAEMLFEKYNMQHKSLDALRFEGEALKTYALKDDTPLGDLSIERLKAIYQAYVLLGYIKGSRDIGAFVYHPERLRLTAEEQAWLGQHPILRVGVDPVWPPIEFMSRKGVYGGVSYGFMRRVAEKLGVRIEAEPKRSWQEVDEALNARELDVAAAIMAVPERHAYMNFTRPYLTLPMVIVGGESFQYVGDLTVLKGKRVAVVKDDAADIFLKRDFPQIQRIQTKSLPDALRMVAFGRADVAVDALAVASYVIAKEGLNNLRIVGQTPYDYEIAMGIRSDWPELQALMQRAIDSIGDEEREAIYRQWVPTVYKHQFDYALLWKILGVLAVIALLFGYKYIRLDELVRRRTRELTELNATLNERVEEAVGENRDKERMMIQQAKMATIGEMIESIAHQWRQPLNVMGIGIANLDLKRQLGKVDDEEVDRLIDIVHRQVDYMSQTIDDFRNFFKKDKQLETVRLRTLVDEVLGLVIPALEQKKIDVVVDVPEQIEAELYPNELKQVILNLVSNAKDVLLQHGAEAKKIRITGKEEGGDLLLFVADNGGGVPEEIMEKIFDPYFTTKFESQGTGIGLYMSKIITEKNLKGHISVENRDGGAEFVIRLPKRQKGA